MLENEGQSQRLFGNEFQNSSSVLVICISKLFVHAFYILKANKPNLQGNYFTYKTKSVVSLKCMPLKASTCLW